MKKIDAFTPKIPTEYWAPIEHFCREAVRDSAPVRPETAISWMSMVAALTDWSVRVEGLPPAREIIFDPANIFDYIAQRPARTDAAQGTARSILLRISARLLGEHPGATDDRRSYNGSKGREPYSRAQKIALRSFVNGQATELRRANLRMIVAFGAGAGLTSTENLLVRAEHVEDRGSLILVHVQGAKKRTSVVLAEWEDYVREAVAAADPSKPLLFPDRELYRKGNAVTDFIWGCNGIGERPHTQRLRTTWIVDHLNANTPVPLLLAAAGIQQATGLDRYLPAVRKLSVADAYDALRLGGAS